VLYSDLNKKSYNNPVLISLPVISYTKVSLSGFKVG